MLKLEYKENKENTTQGVRHIHNINIHRLGKAFQGFDKIQSCQDNILRLSEKIAFLGHTG